MTDEKDNKMDWLLCVYSEAWQLYVHEDTLVEERSMKYLTVATILLSVLQIYAAILAVLIPQMNFQNVIDCVLVIVMFGVGIVISFIFHELLNTWEKVTEAGYNYVNIRFSTALEIEKKYKLEPNIAQYEDEWRKKNLRKHWVGGRKATFDLIKKFRILTITLVIFDFIFCILIFLHMM